MVGLGEFNLADSFVGLKIWTLPIILVVELRIADKFLVLRVNLKLNAQFLFSLLLLINKPLSKWRFLRQLMVILKDVVL